jgi:hypothetical protein
MIDYLGHISHALRATVFHSPTTYSWLGQCSPRLSPTVKRLLTAKTARNYLLHQLRARLYVDFYTRGGAASSPSAGEWTPDPGLGQGDQFSEALSAANSGLGSWESNWDVRSSTTDEVIVHRAGLTLWVRPEDCEAASGGPVTPGVPVRLRLPKEMLGISPGYYMGLGNRGIDSEPLETTVRFYWNLCSRGAAPFLHAVTHRLNRAGLPFHVKVLDDWTRFIRCDAAVVYVPKGAYQDVAALLSEVYCEVSSYLKPETPVFTKPLAPGVGLAEDPGQSESFGQHRCRLLAEGMVRSHERGARSIKKRLQVVAECFEEAGIPLKTPYLNVNSCDDYQVMVS